MGAIRAVGFIAASITTAVIATACATTPLTGRTQFMVVSSADLIPAADAHFERLYIMLRSRGAVLAASNSPEAAQVEQASERILIAAEQHPPDWQVVVARVTDTAAAFVLPNRKIVVFTGLLPVLYNEAGIAAVIGHEVAHVLLRHQAERVSQLLVSRAVVDLATFGLALAGVRYAPLIGTALNVGAMYGYLLPYQREHEFEADRLGQLLMARAGYDPAEAVAVWERMARMTSKGPWEFASTHPSHEMREAQLREWLPEAMGYFSEPARPLPVRLDEEMARARTARAGAAALAPIAPRPSFLPGYWWRVRRSGEDAPITYTYTGTEQCATGICFVLAVDSESTTLLTDEYAVVETRTPEGTVRMSPPMRLMEWPLRVGATWSHPVVVETAGGRTAPQTVRVEVVDYESVTTPAGAFMAFKLVTALGGAKFRESWYAPEIRNEVRVIQAVSALRSITLELVDYQRTDVPVIAPDF